MIIDPNQLMTGDEPRPSRAKLAVAWERLGRQEVADREFETVARVSAKADVAGWRGVGLETIDMWSKVRDSQRGGASPPASGTGPPK